MTHRDLCVSVVALSALSFAVGCSDPAPAGGGSASAKSSSATASATAKSTGTTASTTTATATATMAATESASAAEPASSAVMATCNNEFGGRKLGCKEYIGKIPDDAEAECKKDGAKFAKDGKPCPTADAIGRCTPKNPPAAGYVAEVSYKSGPGDAKGSCEILGNVWTEMGPAKK